MFDKYAEFAIRIVGHEKAVFRSRYHVEPKYLKVPLGFCDVMDFYNSSKFVKTEKRADDIPHFMGLIVTETPTVESLYNIEVF